jgi:hypothetical protein
MRGEPMPTNADGVSMGMGRRRIAPRVREGAELGQEVAQRRIAHMTQSGFSIEDIQSNAREIDLFRAAFDAVDSEYLTQARDLIAAQRQHEINLAGGTDLRVSTIQSLIQSIGANQALPSDM